MAQIPMLDMPQVQTAPLPGVRINAQPTPAAFGAGVAQGLGNAAFDVGAVELRQKADADSMATTAALVSVQASYDSGMTTYKSLAGHDAIASADKTKTDFKNKLLEIRGGMASADQQRDFDLHAMSVYENFNAQVDAHERGQWLALEDTNNKAAHAQSVQSAAIATMNGEVRIRGQAVRDANGFPDWSSTGMLDVGSIATTKMLAKRNNAAFAVRMKPYLGMDAARYVELADQKSLSDINVAVIDGLLAKGDDQTAKAYFDQNRRDLSAAEMPGTEDKVLNAYTLGESQRQGASSWGSAEGATINDRKAAALAAVSGDVPPDWKRADGSTKGTGFLGVLKRPDGGVSSELSIGVEIDGKEAEIPTLVPGLTAKENDYLLGTPESQIATADPAIFAGIQDKAVAHARDRIAAGKSPFANDSGPSRGPALPPEIQAGARKAIETYADKATADETKLAGDTFTFYDGQLQKGADAMRMQQSPGFQWLQEHAPEKAHSLVTIANDIAGGKYATTDDAVYAEVKQQIREAPPEAVSAINPREKVGSGLSADSAAELQKQIDQRAKLASGTLTPDKIVDEASSRLYNEDTFNVANDYTSAKDKAAGAQKRQRQIGAFQRAADDAIRYAQSQTDKPITIEQVQNIVDELTAATLMGKNAWGKNAWGTAVDLSTEAGGVIPAAELVDISTVLRRQGVPVTRESIAKLYEIRLRARDYLPADFPDVGD